MTQLSTLGTVWEACHAKLYEANTHDAIRLRMHRAFSWMRKADDFAIPEDADARLIFSWVAMNTLYAKWDSDRANREPEWQTREDFLTSMVKNDAEGRIQKVLLENRKLCDRLLSEEHLINSYWGNPSEDEARKARSKHRRIGKYYHVANEVIKILLPLMTCITMLRSQLVHGMSTYGSSANRAVVEAGAVIVFEINLAMLQIIAEDGLWQDDESWMPVPYPPMKPHFRRDS
ncbi:MAG: hypothetical protein P8N28_05050 [Phycisphaerales bacterium]|nr:hypothetical protein [Phycisphaerales bacterium]